MASKEQMIDFIIRASTDSGFHGTFSKAQESFTKLSKEIQSLQRVQRDVSSYQKQQTAIEKNEAKVENLQDQYDLLQKEIEETEGSTTALQRESLKLDQRIRETSSALESQRKKLNATGERLQEAKVDTNDLEQADARLTEQLKSLRAEQDRTAQSMETAAGSAEAFGETASSGFTAAGQALAAAGIAAGLKKITDAYRDCIQTSAEFVSSKSYTGALSSASDAEMALLSAKAKEMGADKKFTAKESADAFGYMSLAGWKARQQIAGIEPVLNLATAANMDLAKASDIVTDYLTAFGLTANDAAAFTDKMAYAMSHSNTDVTQLGEAYKNCASTAKSMNYSVEETTAVLMGMANAAVKGGEAGTALGAVMTRLATDTKGCATALAEYDVNVYDAKGNMNSLSEILSGMSRVWVTLSDAEQAALAKTIAGADHYSELQTIMSACSKEAEASGQSFSDYAAALKDCSGTAAQMADRMLDNLSGDLVRMDSALEAVKLTLGEQFTPELRFLTQTGTGALTILNQAMEKHPAATKAIASFIGIMTSATGAVMAYSAAVKAAKALKLNGTIKDMFLSTGPFLGVTAAVGGLVAAFTALNAEWEASVPEVVALNGAVKDLSRTLEETSVHSIENEAQANAAAAGMYLDKIEELGAVQNRTREQELRYQGAMAGLLEVAPELSDFISQTADEYGRVTYAVNGSTEAIRANIEVMKQQAVFDALQDRIKEITGPMGTAMMNIELAEIGRAELEEQYKEPLRQREEIQKKLNAAAGKSDAAAAVRNLNEELRALDAQYGEVFSRVDAFDSQIAEANETVAEADEELLLYNKAMDGVAEKLGVAEDAAGDTAGAVEGLGGSFTDTQEQAKAFKEGLAEISEGVKAVTEAYQAAYNSAYSSVSGQYGLLEKAEKAVPAKLDVIQQALTTQAGYWDSYGQNLETLQQRAEGIAGLADYLARVADGSAESANVLAGLAGLSDDELAGIAEADQELRTKWDEVSGQLADMRGDWEGELDQWRDQLTEAIEEMDQSDEAREAMEETIRALIDTASDPSLRAEMRNALGGLVQIASVSRIGLDSSNGYVSTALLHMDGYASGTDNAERGWKLVGEDGPELMFFQGGERVWNARDTAAALGNAPRYEAALAAPHTAVPVSVQIAVNVQGNVSQDTVDALQDRAAEIAGMVTDQVMDRIHEEQIDAVRRSFST